MSISKALEQMERGMGAGSTPESRAAVNDETMADRAERHQQLIDRQKNTAALPEPEPVKNGEQRLQDGEFGRLD